MKKLLNILIVILSLVVLQSGLEAKPGKDGKAIFGEYKCRSCHSVESQGIIKKVSDEDDADSKGSKEKEAPDLSGVGLERTKDWISRYLMKKEAIDGEKHAKKFKGSEEELAELSKWLEEQKVAKKKKK